LSTGAWDLFGIFHFALRIGKCIQKEIDLLKRVGQEKNPNAYQEKTAHDTDDPHVSFYLIKGREE
jgi:hypothetical protein